MTREEVKNIVRHVFHFYEVNAENCNWTDMNEACEEIFKALEQEPFINKPCVSSGVCEHDKNKVLDKIITEIKQLTSRYTISRERGGMGQVEWSDMLIKESEVLQIIDKYKGETETAE